MADAQVVPGSEIDSVELDRVFHDLDRHGYAVIPDVLTDDEADKVLARLWDAAAESERRGFPTHIPGLDPNESSVRVFNLIDLDRPLFGEMVAHPVADTVVSRLLGDDYIISNFTANIARPGSESMMVHSDLSFVAPEPWVSPDSANIIWCLSDVHKANGATLHIPGSHRFRTRAEVPEDPMAHMVPLEAKRGSILVMEGRVWHTSGSNVTDSEERPLMFGYYSKPHIAPQVDHKVTLSAQTQASFTDAVMRRRLGLDKIVR